MLQDKVLYCKRAHDSNVLQEKFEDKFRRRDNEKNHEKNNIEVQNTTSYACEYVYNYVTI